MTATESRTLDAGLMLAGTVRALVFAVLGSCGAIRFATVEPISMTLAGVSAVVALVGVAALAGAVVALFARS